MNLSIISFNDSAFWGMVKNRANARAVIRKQETGNRNEESGMKVRARVESGYSRRGYRLPGYRYSVIR